MFWKTFHPVSNHINNEIFINSILRIKNDTTNSTLMLVDRVTIKTFHNA